MAARGFLQVAPGRRVALNGVEWTVEDVHGQLGRLVLVDGDGHAETRSFRWLINHADLRLLPAAEAPGPRPAPVSRQSRTLADLTEVQVERARLRAAHVLEAETGFREGHPARALPGEPRPAYDPDRTTLTQRRYAKAAEMKASAVRVPARSAVARPATTCSWARCRFSNRTSIKTSFQLVSLR
jgi:hypothetical protein